MAKKSAALRAFHWFNRHILGIQVKRIMPFHYDYDGLWTVHNHDFMTDPDFIAAYERGVKAAGEDYKWHWRVHVGLWAASVARNLPGDFVECGVNRGALSSAIMTYLDWDSCGKTFYLFDTFEGIDERYISEEERQRGRMEKNEEWLRSGFYVSGVEQTKQNFSEWRNWEIVQGAVPASLHSVDIPEVAYLHLDMNVAAPEVAAAEYFWPRMVKGGVILMDDYAYREFPDQKVALDAFAHEYAVPVLALPTGQGVMLKY